MLRASKRSSSVSYAIRDVILPARKLEKQGKRILHLNIGDPNKYDFDTPQHMKDAVYQAMMDGFNGYAPSEGYPDLIDAIIAREKNRNDMHYDQDNICVTTGVTESLQILLEASLNPNEELIIPGPTYPQYNLITNVNDALPVVYKCIEENGWEPDVDMIRKRMSNRTKAIVVINPNNPTGAVYSEKIIKQIIDIAGEYKIPVVSDEIYDDLTFGDKQTATAHIAKDVPVITFNGFSKVYLVPGWRMGYVLFHHEGELDEIQDAFMRIARSRLSANSVCQKGCVAALTGPQDHIKEVNKKLKKRRDFCFKRLNEIPGISTQRPEGAFYIFPKIEAMDQKIWKDDKEFVLDLLHDQHVLVVHGSGFCKTYGKNHFRAVILPQMDVLEEAFDNLETFMNKRIKKH